MPVEPVEEVVKETVNVKAQRLCASGRWFLFVKEIVEAKRLRVQALVRAREMVSLREGDRQSKAFACLSACARAGDGGWWLCKLHELCHREVTACFMIDRQKVCVCGRCGRRRARSSLKQREQGVSR
eukprot:TRINITY_DN5648_c0_g1_i12.p2 TRINITY_DN5648_c0_g1~~TRINITY_DN5648_c0_g1_i12.p2  ORF type:complete len:127 (-),score=12.50 TRINITY_DN5648_c0_g1_i12:191-571(-)